MTASAEASRPPPVFGLLGLLDRPALSALQLARARPLATLAPAAVGLGLAVVGAVLADAATTGPALALYGLRALLEALAVVVPTSLIFFTYVNLRVPPRAFLAAAALGLATAGVFGLSLMPLLAFAAVAGQGALPFLAQPAVVLPFALAIAVAAVVLRVVRSIDPRDLGWSCSLAFFALFVGAFTLRFHAALDAASTGGF
jgi:hypothetical protein